MTGPPLQSFPRFVAIDIHKSYLMVGAIDIEQRIVLQPRKVELHRWLVWAQANLLPTDAAVLEATTNAWTIYDQLVGLVARVVVVHPAKVKLIAASRVKTDKVDVLTLAQLLRADMLPEVPEGGRKHGWVKGELSASCANRCAVGQWVLAESWLALREEIG
jgi:hypothetical protein